LASAIGPTAAIALPPQLLGGFAKIEVFGDSAKDFEAKILKLRHGWLTE
jgi:hypothetical protein